MTWSDGFSIELFAPPLSLARSPYNSRPMIAQLFLRYIGRALVWLRYRVDIDGLDQLRKIRGPLLVLPNHPGYIDPVLVMTQLGGEISLRPLVVSFMYRPIYLRPLMMFINALEVPDLVAHSQSAREQVEPLINTVVAELDRGGRFVIYPAGRIERNGLERIGSTRAVPDILARRPETTIVVVRTVGAWGSMSTYAQTGKEPNLAENFVRALGVLASNLIFLAPRRHIKMTVEIVDKKTLPGLDDLLDQLFVTPNLDNVTTFSFWGLRTVIGLVTLRAVKLGLDLYSVVLGQLALDDLCHGVTTYILGLENAKIFVVSIKRAQKNAVLKAGRLDFDFAVVREHVAKFGLNLMALLENVGAVFIVWLTKASLFKPQVTLGLVG